MCSRLRYLQAKELRTTSYTDVRGVAHHTINKRRLTSCPTRLQMFVGESGCWLVVLLSYLFRRFGKTSSTTLIQDVAYQPVGQDDNDQDEREEEEYEGDLSSSQTLVDPTNVVAKSLIDGESGQGERLPLGGWKVTLLALPAICDICGTTLMNVGLLFVAASIYQMTRGALVLFVGLFSVLFLKRHLGGWKWASLVIVVLGVAVVGLAGALEQKGSRGLPDDSNNGSDELFHKDMVRSVLRNVQTAVEQHTAFETVVGILMIAGAQIFTATQFVLEESIMERYSLDPIKVVGWEGFFGFVVTLIGMGVLHAAVGQTEAGQGGYFDARAGFQQIFHNRAIGVSSILIMFSIGGFNFFGLSVTRSISATSRSTIDTCRTLFIWLVSLGLGWETFKWLQVLGFVLLVYGTGLFNDIIGPPTVAFLRRRRDGTASS